MDVVGTPLALVAARGRGRSPARRLLVMGHIDEIGLIVTHVDDDGFLWFRAVGGWDAQVLVGQRLVVDTRQGPVTGVIGRKAVHLQRDEESKKVVELRDMHIDIGARDAAIVVDVTHATDAPGAEVKASGKHELGSGPVISRGSTLNPALFELLARAAEEEKIPFTIEASARATGTDADAVHLSRGGVPTALVSIPIRYMHSPVELVQLDDVHAAARLIAAAALRLDVKTSFAR